MGRTGLSLERNTAVSVPGPTSSMRLLCRGTLGLSCGPRNPKCYQGDEQRTPGRGGGASRVDQALGEGEPLKTDTWALMGRAGD